MYTEHNYSRGWLYTTNFIQESFEWRISDNQKQLKVINWRYQFGTDATVSVDDDTRDENWTILQLTPTRIIVSYRMFPLDSNQPYDEILTLGRIR